MVPSATMTTTTRPRAGRCRCRNRLAGIQVWAKVRDLMDHLVAEPATLLPSRAGARRRGDRCRTASATKVADT